MENFEIYLRMTNLPKVMAPIDDIPPKDDNRKLEK